MKRYTGEPRNPPHVAQVGVRNYGCSDVLPDGRVILFTDTIRNGVVGWKRAGESKFDARHGFYAVTAGLPSGVYETLERLLRERS